MAGSLNNTGRISRFWPEGSEWQGIAKAGDYIGLGGHVYELIKEPCVISMRAMNPDTLKPDVYSMTEGEAQYG